MDKFLFELRLENLSSNFALALLEYFEEMGCEIIDERMEGTYHIITYEKEES